MTEPKTPVFNAKKQCIEVRDRARPNVAFQQGEYLFDRKKNFVEKAAFAINIPEPKPVEAVTRDISQRKVGSTKATIVGKGVAREKTRAGKPRIQVGVHAKLQTVSKENAQAAAAESVGG